MSVTTITTQITSRKEVQVDIELVECMHGKKPTIENIYTGKGRFQGATADCGFEGCLCYDNDAEDVAKKWNRFHGKDKF